MKKITNLLDGAAKPIGSLAAIALGLSIISFAAVTIKDNCKILFPSSKKKIKAIICIKKDVKHSADEIKPKNEEELVSKPVVKKSTSKSTIKNTSTKEEEVKESALEPKAEPLCAPEVEKSK